MDADKLIRRVNMATFTYKHAVKVNGGIVPPNTPIKTSKTAAKTAPAATVKTVSAAAVVKDTEAEQ